MTRPCATRLAAVLLGLAVASATAPAQPPPGDKGGETQLPPPRMLQDGGPPLELVEFRDVPLGEALRLLSQQSGLKLVASAEAGKTLVSLYLRDVPPMVAVSSLTQAYGLIYRR